MCICVHYGGHNTVYQGESYVTVGRAGEEMKDLFPVSSIVLMAMGLLFGFV